jgi:hypothetical protein
MIMALNYNSLPFLLFFFLLLVAIIPVVMSGNSKQFLQRGEGRDLFDKVLWYHFPKTVSDFVTVSNDR